MAAVLTWVSATKSAVLGFLYLFVFSLGMCTLLVAIGLSSGFLARLPRAGEHDRHSGARVGRVCHGGDVGTRGRAVLGPHHGRGADVGVGNEERRARVPVLVRVLAGHVY